MNNDSKKKAGILRNNAFQTIIASLLCIVIGLLIGYVVLLIINPKGAAGAITAILKNYFYYPSQKAMMKYMGTTLVKASALLMCSLSVLFAYKVGLFNIGSCRTVCSRSRSIPLFRIEAWYALVCVSS